MRTLLTRRAALLGLTGAVTLGRASLALADAPTEQRFAVVILRGGLLDLGGFYGLHPALVNLHGIYQANELIPVHAVAGPYRLRSHFEAQDCLESGADHRMTSGWLNRAATVLPRSPDPKPEGDALAIGVAIPLLLRGPALVGNWAPHGFAQPAPDLYSTIAALNRPDRLTGPAIAEGLRARGFSNLITDPDGSPKNRYAFPALARMAGEMLARPDGPRLAAMEIGGWDTHAAQASRLTGPLRQLDSGLAALKSALGPAWRQTVVLAMTEFGRTARVNGTKGTDHGTATVAFVLGGAVAGGRVEATWPGLGSGKLFEDRDLSPTTDLRSVAKGLLAQHFGLSSAVLEQVFPASGSAQPLRGLLRT